jgi:hypothetical protein
VDVASAAQHLARLTRDIIGEVAEHHSARDDLAGHGDRFPETRPGWC